jgi:ubiquinone/menaquinone biosynthesis C-methylase UbiE
VALTLNQARSVYDRIGRVQDWQAFYEDATTDRLVANAALAGDQTILEFGCGTGRLAARLLGTLPRSVTYLGIDISPVMINLATSRLAPWAERAKAGASRRHSTATRR